MSVQLSGERNTTVLEELLTYTGKVFLKIELDPAKDWVIANWIGYPTHEHVAKGAMAYLDQMKAAGCKAVLNDNRLLVGRWDQSLDWLEQNWIPYAVTSGLKYWAHLDNAGNLSVDSAEMLRERIKGRFEVELFEDKLAAENWLDSKLRAKL